MLSRKSSAASQQLHELPPSGTVPGAEEARRQATPSIGADKPSLLANPSNLTGAAGAPNRSKLPAWAQNDEARALLATIIAEQPERDRPLTQLATGQTASFGYRGKAANRLRQLFDPFLMERMAWSYKAGFDTPLFRKRRAAVLRYADDHGPDALIARVLEARHG